MITCLIAGAAFLAPGQAATEVNWVRTFKEKDKATYSVSMDLDSPKLTGKTDLVISVLSAADPAKVQIVMEATKTFGIAQANSDSLLKSGISTSGIPDAIELVAAKSSNPVFTLWGAAATVANKKVRAGDTYEIAWKNKQGNMKITGKGNVLEIDATKKTLKAKVTLAVEPSDLGGQTAAYEFTGVYNTTDGSLVTANGTFGMQGIFWKIDIKRL